MGVYYASNAVGRLVGTLASGALYSYAGSTVVDGFGICLMVSVGFAAVSCLVDFFLQEEPNAQGETQPATQRRSFALRLESPCRAAGVSLFLCWSSAAQVTG